MFFMKISKLIEQINPADGLQPPLISFVGNKRYNMLSMSMFFVIAVIVATVISMQAVLLFFIRKKQKNLVSDLQNRAFEIGETLIMGPEPSIYRGADSEFGSVKGNGVIALTNRRIMFKKLTGQQIDIDLSHITKVSVQSIFNGETAVGTGAQHLVVETKNGNRIGFLVKRAERWMEILDT